MSTRGKTPKCVLVNCINNTAYHNNYDKTYAYMPRTLINDTIRKITHRYLLFDLYDLTMLLFPWFVAILFFIVFTAVVAVTFNTCHAPIHIIVQG